MKIHSYKINLLIIGIVSFACNIISLNVVNLFSKKFNIDIRINDLFNIPEALISSIFSALIIAFVVILKDKRKMLLSFAICSLINELINFAFIMKNYDLQSYNYSSNATLLILLSITVLFVLSCVTVKKKQYDKLKMCSITFLVAYLAICVLPVILFDSFINISSFVYYISLYMMFILLAKNQ